MSNYDSSKLSPTVLDTHNKAFMQVYKHQQQIVNNQRFIYYLLWANIIITSGLLVLVLAIVAE